MKNGLNILKRGGFTLIELLVALTLFGILAGAMAGVFRNTSDSLEQGRSQLDNISRMRALDMLLRGALSEGSSKEISQRERNLLSSMDSEYDPTYGKYRFRGEESSLGFCMPRPFTGGAADGYTHWILLEARTNEKGGVSLWLRDVSFLWDVDNPAGESWEGTDINDDYALPTQEICLIEEALYIAFRYQTLEEDGLAGEPQPEEMEEDDVEGDYSRLLPDYIEMDIRLPNMKTETLTFEWNAKESAL